MSPLAARPRSVLPIVLAACGLVGAAAIGAVVLLRPHKDRPVASVPAAAAPTAPAPPATIPPSVAVVAPPPSAPPPQAHASTAPPPEPPPAIAPDRGELRFPPFAAGHRIFVDGHVVGDGADPAVIHCGPHDVQIGSAGTRQHVDVPCGGALTVTAR